MTAGAELRGGGAHHGVIGEAEEGKSHDNPYDDIENRLEKFSHGNPRKNTRVGAAKKNLSVAVSRHKGFTSPGKKTEHGHKGSILYKIFSKKATLFSDDRFLNKISDLVVGVQEESALASYPINQYLVTKMRASNYEPSSRSGIPKVPLWIRGI